MSEKNFQAIECFLELISVFWGSYPTVRHLVSCMINIYLFRNVCSTLYSISIMSFALPPPPYKNKLMTLVACLLVFVHFSHLPCICCCNCWPFSVIVVVVAVCRHLKAVSFRYCNISFVAIAIISNFCCCLSGYGPQGDRVSTENTNTFVFLICAYPANKISDVRLV